jgi:hypothetical protein
MQALFIGGRSGRLGDDLRRPIKVDERFFIPVAYGCAQYFQGQKAKRCADYPRSDLFDDCHTACLFYNENT